MKTLALVLPVPLVCALIVGCSGSEPGGASATGAGADALPSACSSYFDALVARKARCGAGRDMLNLDSFEGARESALARCLQQGRNVGTGYTAAFYEQCSTTLTSAACDDDDAIVRACWEPRGALARGMGCATDDQCADGYCKLPTGAQKGSTCGTCDVPVWVEHGACSSSFSSSPKNAKCRPGLECSFRPPGDYGCRSPRDQYGAAGDGCDDRPGGDYCADGFTCRGKKCVPLPIAHVGESCASAACEAGSSCIAAAAGSDVCAKTARLGEPCDAHSEGRAHPRCDHWLACSPTHRCELPIILDCK